MAQSISRHGGMTARTRILGWIMLIVSVAIVAIVVVTARSTFARVDAQMNAELTHEAEKFRTFATQPDPSTGREFFSVRELLTSHLQHNLPETTEVFFSIVDGKADRRSVGEPRVRLDTNTTFVREAASATKPESGTLNTAEGPATYAVIPVTVKGDSAKGHLVIAEFPAKEYDEAWTTTWVMSLVALVALLLAGITGWFIAGRVLAPIRDVRETASRISETDLGRRIDVVGSDDVARLAETFNGMLDRLESAFDGQRRFLDDAGHELRTPITIIRGHLEVMGDDPEDREQTMRLVGDELGRMSRLVDDLILLARSERPDFLAMNPTELTDLVVETFTKATALAQREWVIDNTPEGFALVDGQRLTQALLQLATNAVAHTAEADTIALGGRIDDQGMEDDRVKEPRLRLWVRDTGTGIPEKDQQRIFERFTRASTDHRGPSRGLGLAIVTRIAEAHGGHAIVESIPGEGATFTLDLPMHQEEQ